MSEKIIVLDRDGVINFDSVDYIKNPDEWVPIPGSIEAIALLCQKGYSVFVATNQAGIARGKLTEGDLAAIHEKMIAAVAAAGGQFSGIEYCPHHPDDNCPCRKPKPGMLRAIEKSLGAPLKGHPFVGDSLKDVRAAKAIGCVPVLVLTGSGAETHTLRPDVKAVFPDLLAYAQSL